MKKVNKSNVKVNVELAQLEAMLAEELGTADVAFGCGWNFGCGTNNG